jgi:hypothetical protein
MTEIHGKGLPGWVELAANDPETAVKFYSELFGWEINIMDSNDSFQYRIIMNGDKMIGGLAGKMNEYQPSAWLTYLETDEIDKAISDVKANGGMVYLEPMPMPGGKFTVASDPSGTPFGIIEVEKGHTNDTIGEVHGICWYELDVKAHFDETVNFYEQVFGWSPNVELDTPEMHYLMVGDSIGVFTGNEFPDYLHDQSQWAVTFHVVDVEVAAAKAEVLGGKILNVSKDTPYGDFAMLADPEGAFFVVMKPNRESK